MAHEHLAEIVKRILETGSTGSLNDSELEELRVFAQGREVRDPPCDKRPLWHWIREGFYNAPIQIQERFGRGRWEYLGHLVTRTGEAEPPSTIAGSLLAPVTRRRLRTATETVLSEQSALLLLQKAAWVAGFAGFQDLIPEISALVESEDSIMSLNREECLDGLFLLNASGFQELLRQFPDLNESYLHPLGAVRALRSGRALGLEEIERALPVDRWTSEETPFYPDLVLAFGREGGSLEDALESLQKNLPLAWSTGNWVVFAEAVLAREDPVLLDHVATEAASANNQGLLLALCMEAGAGRCTWTLDVFRGLVKDTDSPAFDEGWRESKEDPEKGRSHERFRSPGPLIALLWVIELLEGETEGATSEPPCSDLGEDVASAVRLLVELSCGNMDSSMSELDKTAKGIVAWLADVVGEILAGRGISALQKILWAREVETAHLFEFVYILERVRSAFGDGCPVLSQALRVLMESIVGPQADPVEPMNRGMAEIWARTAVQRGFSGEQLTPILRRISALPPEQALGPLEVCFLGRLPEVGILAAELACLEKDSGSFAKTVIRLVSRTPSSGDTLSEEDRIAVLLLLSQEDRPLSERNHLIKVIQGDSIADPVLAAWTFSGHLSQDTFRGIGIVEPELESFLRGVRAADDLSRVIVAEDDGLMSPSEMAGRLLCSPVAALRARAVRLLFRRETVPDDWGYQRLLLCSDPDPLVQAAVLQRVGSSPFSDEEFDAVVSGAKRTEDSSVQESLAEALGRRGSPKHLPILFRLARDDGYWKVPAEARKSIGDVVERHNLDLIHLSVAEPREVIRRYLLSSPIPLPTTGMDDKEEAMTLLLHALEDRGMEEKAAKFLSRRVLISPVQDWPLPPPAGTRLSQAEFEALAVFLQVLFVDEESGTVVTEVTEEKTGEVLNAIFETGEIALLTAEWG